MSLFLGGTGSANECHDYEEGSFTMSLSQGSNTSNRGRYVKIGTMVLAAGDISLDNISLTVLCDFAKDALFGLRAPYLSINFFFTFTC